MAKNRKKKGPSPVNKVGHKDYKDRWRRVIRIMMVAVAVILLVVALGIPMVNNAIALGVEKELKALPLPEGTTLVKSSSVAGKLTGNGNGMQYFGALLVKSELDAPALAAYYNGLEASVFSDYRVVPYTGDDTGDRVVDALPFMRTRVGEGHYVVYRAGAGDSPLQEWLDIDLRGH